ncbi:phosphotransferase [Vibrio taketomensis]|uniref:phosphotransferase n=1 Tax=Vibrio taketomensis TaxID=2572923 RepID=UPI00138A070C|nr:phosphotransferase [Vibrio taketomensis]
MDITNAIGKRITTKLGEVVIRKFLGKGKSGYSYLAESNDGKYVIKFMHYEPCAYYSFGDANKVELEVEAFEKLASLGIKVPRLIEANAEHNYLLKEYIEGDLVTELVIAGSLTDACVKQVFEMARALKEAELNIDYFPDNFVVMHNVLYYVDYEYNQYAPNWDLPNWGIYYWANALGMKKYRETKDVLYINQSADSGLPIKQPFEDMVKNWCESFG